MRKAFFFVIWPSRTVRKSQPFTSGRLPSASVPVNVRSETAVLVSLSDNTPFIGSVMTLPVHKGEGLAQLVTTSSMSSLAEDGHRNIVLYITEGNKPSEALFRSVGAVPTPGQ
ncbi:MAG: hypothetical protein IH818_10310 [Acidobacteria bacterium]|nr:hypothetical protein [Acidobacteriota bacterium]